MLVISPSLVLSPAEAALPAGVPLFLFDNKVTFSNVSASSEDPDYPATNLANPATNQEWRSVDDSTPLPSQIDIDVDINSVDLVDGVGIARHNFGTAGIAVSVLAVDIDNTPTETVLAGPQIPPNDEPLLFNFTERSFTTLRIRLDCNDQPARAACLYAGKILRMPRGYEISKDVTPPRFARKSDILNAQSHRGDYLGEIMQSQWIEGAAFEFRHLLPGWYRDYFDPFIRATRGRKPFFFAWSPEDYPYEVAYTWHTVDPKPLTSLITNRKAVTIELAGITQ